MRRRLSRGSTVLTAAALGMMGAGHAQAHPSMHAHREGQKAHVTVTPSTGYPGTFFHVGFRAPDRAGKVGGEERYYVVSASGPAGGGNCASEVSRDAGSTRAHARVRATLKPGPEGWCTGTFHGTVTEQERPACPRREACPMYVVLVRRVGRFSFTVGPQPPGGDITPPAFAGLESAAACTPGPQRPGQTTPYHLSWRAAHDAVTPRSRIVYDIFMSSTSGGENYTQPNWTTAPGVTKFQTPGLPSHSSVYFVVRARDQGGNEDANQIERPGVDPCL
jgi:hypothetical protein